MQTQQARAHDEHEDGQASFSHSSMSLLSLSGSVGSVAAGDESLGKCLYISGVPGTGKTATVMEILRQVRRRVEAGELPRFQLVEINGNRLPSPYHAYTHLYEVHVDAWCCPFVDVCFCGICCHLVCLY